MADRGIATLRARRRPVVLIPAGVAKAWRRVWRWLLLAHRWVGVAFAGLFVMWFVSGAVMMYVPFPSLTERERLAGLPPLALGAIRVDADAAIRRAGLDGWPRDVRLVTTLGRPAWQLRGWDDTRHTVFADDGSVLQAVGEADALRSAIDFAARRAATPTPTTTPASPPRPRHLGIIERDQWTVPNGLNALRPFHHVAVGDAAGAELYVSSLTGEVTRDTTRLERFWNWLGSVPHWIYFTPIRQRPPLWHDVVVWVSGIAIFSAVSGMVIGVMRLRLRRRERPQRALAGAPPDRVVADGSPDRGTGVLSSCRGIAGLSPYRGVAAWHHWLGVTAGLLLTAWIVSGWLSMNPNGWFDRRALPRAELEAYAGSDGRDPSAAAARFSAWLATARSNASNAEIPREVQLRHVGGRPVVTLLHADGREASLDPVDPSELRRAAARLQPSSRLLAMTRLDAPDRYYYAHHGERPLPVWRAVFDDAAETWVHIDAQTGRIVGTSDTSRRTYRWLFNALHSLDLPWLIAHRPAWDVLVLAGLAAGTALSATAAIIGWRRLRRRVGRSA